MIRFFRKQSSAARRTDGHADFAYLPENTYYFDSACQTLRPQPVIDAEMRYYHAYNACAGRVKYPWGVQADTAVADTRTRLLRFAGKSAREYDVVFTLNTTYGINLVLQQLAPDGFGRIVTSEIEHNSVFLPTISWKRRHHKERLVLPREDSGALRYAEADLRGAIVLVNSTSNIDGRTLTNARRLADDAHRNGGLLFLDAAQTFGHDPELLRDVDFDAAFGSGHKMYSPSIGFIILRRELLRSIDPYLIGGGTVQDVTKDSFTLISNDDELHARLEPGLQNWAGIVGLGAAVEWMEDDSDGSARERMLGERLFLELKAMPRVTLLNTLPSPILSFFVDGLDAHRLALYLGEQGIMCRSGTFCCHYYLTHLRQYPPLLRVSLGRHNTGRDIDHFVSTLSAILRTL